MVHSDQHVSEMSRKKGTIRSSKDKKEEPILLRERNQPEKSILWGSKHLKVWKKQRAETVKR